ncbi:MAG: ATP-binding protein, partial [Cyanobacteria bacterium P01_F01_bin.3]
MLTHWEATENRALQQQWSYAQFLLSLCQQEADRRAQARLKRAKKEAQLPAVKSLTSFDFEAIKFGRDYIIPKPMDARSLSWVAPAVARAAIESGVAREPRDIEQYTEELRR